LRARRTVARATQALDCRTGKIVGVAPLFWGICDLNWRH
jgi:hypothetical protein